MYSVNGFIAKNQKYKSILRVMDNHPDALGEKEGIIAIKEKLNNNSERIGELISALINPLANVYRPKTENVQNLRNELLRMAGLGILIAKRHNDVILKASMKQYCRMSYKAASYQLSDISIQVADILNGYLDDGAILGFTADEVTAFRSLAGDVAAMIDETRFQLTERRRCREEIRDLIRSCTAIIAEEIDPFVKYVSTSYPEFVLEYKVAKRGSSKRKNNGETIVKPGEISGTIADSSTGEALEGVTVDIVALNLVTETDEDGYYAFEGLPAGTHRVSCHINGYEVPEAQVVTIGEGESKPADFGLMPASNQAAA